MTDVSPSSRWLPNRPPTVTEISLATVFSVTWVPLQFVRLEAVSWPSVAVGFLLTAMLIGPVASSSFGKRIEDRAQSVGLIWRVLGLATIIVVLISIARYAVSEPAGICFSLGGICAATAVVWVQLIRFRSVSG